MTNPEKQVVQAEDFGEESEPVLLYGKPIEHWEKFYLHLSQIKPNPEFGRAVCTWFVILVEAVAFAGEGYQPDPKKKDDPHTPPAALLELCRALFSIDMTAESIQEMLTQLGINPACLRYFFGYTCLDDVFAEILVPASVYSRQPITYVSRTVVPVTTDSGEVISWTTPTQAELQILVKNALARWRKSSRPNKPE